jgi:hypothetical protein
MSVVTKIKVDLDQLRKRETELAEQVEATRGRLSEYSTLIAEARREAVYAGKARPGGELGGAVRALIDKDRKDATALIGLEGDLSAVRSVIAEEAARQAEQETAEARAQLALSHEQEEAIWAAAGKLLGELASTWNKYVELAEQEDKLANASGIATGILAVEPAPLSFRSWLLLLHVAATDQEVRAEPHTEQLVDSGVYGRRDEHGNDIGGAVYDTRTVGTRTLETRRRLDERDVLYRVVPDLRSIVRKLTLSGRVPKFTAE